MNGNEGVLLTIADPEVCAAITANSDLLPSAPASILQAGNDITVGTTRQTGAQGYIQVPEGEEKEKKTKKQQCQHNGKLKPYLMRIFC